MYKYSLTLFFYLALLLGYAQESAIVPFEGVITYDLKLKDMTGEMSPQEMKGMMGDQQVYTIKRDKYVSEMNGMMGIKQIYLGGDTLFNQMMGALMYVDATQNPDSLIRSEITEKAGKILGKPCSKLTIWFDQGISEYYFHPDYAVDPSDYATHAYGFWDLYIGETKALPLKIVYKDDEISLEATATDIKAVSVDESVFDLPNLPRMVMPE